MRLTVGGAHIHGKMSDEQVSQVAGIQYQRPSDHR
jgi:hypothetical protein